MNIYEVQKLVEKDSMIFLSYDGNLSQELITSMVESIEQEVKDCNISITASSNIFTVFIELSQNMMNYSKSIDINSLIISPKGFIFVNRDKNYNFHIHSQNIVSQADKDKMEPELLSIQSFDEESIRKKYRELRKNGNQTHKKGGGIGFYEIARRCDSIEFDFTKINEDRYYFYIKTNVNIF